MMPHSRCGHGGRKLNRELGSHVIIGGLLLIILLGLCIFLKQRNRRLNPWDVGRMCQYCGPLADGSIFDSPDDHAENCPHYKSLAQIKAELEGPTP